PSPLLRRRRIIHNGFDGPLGTMSPSFIRCSHRSQGANVTPHKERIRLPTTVCRTPFGANGFETSDFFRSTADLQRERGPTSSVPGRLQEGRSSNWRMEQFFTIWDQLAAIVTYCRPLLRRHAVFKIQRGCQARCRDSRDNQIVEA